MVTLLSHKNKMVYVFIILDLMCVMTFIVILNGCDMIILWHVITTLITRLYVIIGSVGLLSLSLSLSLFSLSYVSLSISLISLYLYASIYVILSIRFSVRTSLYLTVRPPSISLLVIMFYKNTKTVKQAVTLKYTNYCEDEFNTFSSF